MSFELSQKPGSYRWYYLDVSSAEWSAVAIFMLGSLFSSRYVGVNTALPERHAAVNFALYRKGRRVAWVLSEYDGAQLAPGGRRLQIGDSSLEKLPSGELVARIVDRTPWWGTEVTAEVRLQPQVTAAPSVTLVPGLPHRWHPYAIRAAGMVSVPSRRVVFAGRGYHDGNSGPHTLGTDLPSWSWVRTHAATHSEVLFSLPTDTGWQVSTEEGITTARAVSSPRPRVRRTGWGLDVSSILPDGASGRLLESSPFYARLEGVSSSGVHTLGESADFARFRNRWVKWMANVRTRVVREAPR